MSKISIHDLSYHYIQHYKPVFELVNLVLDTDWKLGLIGRNGRGKSTFLHLLHGRLNPGRGSIAMEVQTELFPYEISTTYTKTIDIIKESIGGLKALEDAMDEILRTNPESRLEEYQQLFERYIDLDGFQMESRIHKELSLMKLPEDLLERDYQSLSGGEKTKMQIIALFLRKNAFVLLDEPTNHLDIEGKETLAEYLQCKKGFIVVSHDRDFLDRVIDHVLSINKATIALEKGNYSSWKRNKDQREAYEFRTRTRLEKEIHSLERQAVNKRGWASTAESTKNQHGKYERSSGSRAAQFMKHAKNAELEVKESIEEKKQLLKNYEEAKELVIGQDKSWEGSLMRITKLSFGYTEPPCLSNLTFSIYPGDRIWIKGKNGSGKTTLLKLLAGQLPSPKDTIESAEDLVLTQACQEPLWKEGRIKTLVPDQETLEKIIALCKSFDLSDETLERPIETFSSGEMKKLDIARALSGKNQLILLDEPLNYMDVYFREQLEKAILKYQPTIVFVEHEERFGQNVSNKVIRL